MMPTPGCKIHGHAISSVRGFQQAEAPEIEQAPGRRRRASGKASRSSLLTPTFPRECLDARNAFLLPVLCQAGRLSMLPGVVWGRVKCHTPADAGPYYARVLGNPSRLGS